jgi:nucleoid-associated protein YgaU
MSSLAQEYYGDVKYTQLLIDGNPGITDPDRLAVGTVLQIPPRPAEAPAASGSEVMTASSPARNAANPRTYTVKAGDTFYGVARDVLGDASRWRELLALNNDLVHGDPTRLQVGQVIVLPE